MVVGLVVVVLGALVLVLLLCRVLVGMWVFSFPVSFPETDGGSLWGNLSPVSFPETAGVCFQETFLGAFLLRTVAPQHSFVFES